MTDFKDAHQLGQATKIETIEISGVTHVQVPPGCDLQSMEQLMPAPQRIVASPVFTDIAGFAAYIKEFKEAGSRIFVDDKNWSFITVFDCHAKDQPAWGDHSASMDVVASNEWKRFQRYNDKKMSPSEFAEFLEDNIEYLAKSEGLSGADLLSMAQSFKIKLKGNIEVDETLSQGMKKLVIIDDSTIRGAKQNGKEVSFPETLSFDLRIFKNHASYPIKVFLRTRHDDTSLHFFIKIPDVEGLEEEAFDRVIEAVAKETKLPTLKGSFKGKYHK